MSLSSLIVQREIATIRQVEEALARQVLYGGDLATNLLEVAAVEEWRVAVTCADAAGLAAAPPGRMPSIPPDVLSLVPAEIAAQRGILPLSGDRKRLVLAASEAIGPLEMEQLSASLRVERIEVRIALQVRIREALVTAYGVPLERRMERLLGRMVKPSAGEAPPPAPSQPKLEPSSIPPFKLSPAYGVPATKSPLAPENREETPGPPPPQSQPKLRTTAAGFPAPPSRQPAPVETPAPPVTVPAPQAKPTFVKPSNSSPPPKRDLGPLTLAAAQKALEAAVDRDALLDVFFEYTRQFFDYTAVFVAHGDIAEGRDSFGEGTPREKVVGIGVPLDMPSMLQDAREKKAAVVTRPAPDGVDGILLSDLKRPAGVEVAVVPLLVRGRTVAMIYADSTSSVDRTALAKVTAFAASVGQAFEKLIVRKKLAGITAGAPKSEVGKVEARAAAVVEPKGSEKIARANALGKALFEAPEPESDAGKAPASLRAKTPEPVAPPRSSTPGETPRARGSIPPVLTSPPSPEPPPPPPPPKRDHPSSRPPPPMVAAVRNVSGPPIPREEPEPEEAPPSLETTPLDEETQQALLAELGEISPDAPPGVVMEIPLAPESDQVVAVGPRRPPQAHNEVSLPSIIVDIAGELSALVDRALADEHGMAEGELLRLGASAMPAIMARFPGPLVLARNQVQEPLPRPSECGPLLRLIARQRKVALAYVLEEVASPDVSRRFWATFLLVELPYAEGVRRLVPRLFDPDAKVRLVARAAARAAAESAHEVLLAEIGRIVREPSTSRTARLGLLEALGDLREPKAVPMLIGHLGDEDAELATVARRSLIAITRQDHALDARKWLSWWGQSSTKHRIEWLIDALVDETPGIRRAAGEELKNLTHETFGYYDDLPKRERERAQQRFRDWWASEGRARFVRS